MHSSLGKKKNVDIIYVMLHNYLTMLTFLYILCLTGVYTRYIVYYNVHVFSVILHVQDKVLEDMDDDEEMQTFSSSEDESDETDEELENERRLQKAMVEKDKVWITIILWWSTY